ncbi:MAG: deoxycytidylate deaminase [Anaeroplasmataceae bacterium]
MDKDYISWDEYFMGIAVLSSKRSKDPNTKVGACIVNKNNRIIGIGYNGLPTGCSDEEFPWDNSKEKDVLDTKYPYVVHAEPNAILNARASVENAIMYVTLFPCNECAKLIIQSGIKKIVYMSDKYKDGIYTIASKKLFEASGVEFVQMKEIHIDIHD